MKKLLLYGIMLVIGVILSHQYWLIPLALGYVVVTLCIIKRFVR